MESDAKAVMLRLGIDIDVTSRLDEQSTAIQQMVSIARACTSNTKLLIMDEATSSLSDNEITILFNLVKKLKEQNISTIFVTHKMDEIYRLCDRATILKDGELVTCGLISELPKLKLVSLMLGRDASEIINKKKQYHPEKQNAEILCSVKGIKKANRRLNGVDIVIRKGEVVGLAGLLGAGKTELAKVFCRGFHYAGEIIYNHRQLSLKAVRRHQKGRKLLPGGSQVEEFSHYGVKDNLTMTIMEK
jgi:ABC-type sugar transport system ATPase subunit